MANKTLQTRIKLKYDSYVAWETVKDTFVPLKGEVCICEIPASTGSVVNEPAILVKVGDGTKTYGALPYMSALAADVYSWAKAANKPTYSATEITGLEAYIGEKIQDTDTDTRYTFTKDDTTGTLTITPSTYDVKAGTHVDGTPIVFNAVSEDELAAALEPYAKSADVKTTTDGLAGRIKTLEDMDHDFAAADTALETKLTAAIATAKGEAITDAEGKIATAKAEAIADAESKVNALANGAVKTNTDAIAAINNESTGILAEAKAYTDEVKSGILGEGITETFDTLKEIEDWITKQGGAAVDLTKAIADEATARENADKALGDRIDAIDTGVMSVATGSANGTISVDGTDVAVKGLQDAAYTTVSALNTTAQEYANTAEGNAKAYADGLATNYDAAGTAQGLIEGLDVEALAVGTTETIKSISQVDGKIVVEKQSISGLAQSAITGLPDALDAKANNADLAAIAKTGKIEDLGQDAYVIFDCGSSTINV